MAVRLCLVRLLKNLCDYRLCDYENGSATKSQLRGAMTSSGNHDSGPVKILFLVL